MVTGYETTQFRIVADALPRIAKALESISSSQDALLKALGKIAMNLDNLNQIQDNYAITESLDDISRGMANMVDASNQGNKIMQAGIDGIAFSAVADEAGTRMKLYLALKERDEARNRVRELEIDG